MSSMGKYVQHRTLRSAFTGLSRGPIALAIGGLLGITSAYVTATPRPISKVLGNETQVLAQTSSETSEGQRYEGDVLLKMGDLVGRCDALLESRGLLVANNARLSIPWGESNILLEAQQVFIDDEKLKASGDVTLHIKSRHLNAESASVDLRRKIINMMSPGGRLIIQNQAAPDSE